VLTGERRVVAVAMRISVWQRTGSNQLGAMPAEAGVRSAGRRHFQTLGGLCWFHAPVRLVYPRLRLPPVATRPALPWLTGDRQALILARKQRRTAYSAFLRNTMESLEVCCCAPSRLWAVGYRVCFSIYPWQVELLATGLAQEEAYVAQNACPRSNEDSVNCRPKGKNRDIRHYCIDRDGAGSYNPPAI